jgi:hypothetical protein
MGWGKEKNASECYTVTEASEEEDDDGDNS